MEKNLYMIYLYEIYGKLLTSHMQEIFELYYYSDLSLREIGENKKISYQAVRDVIKKSEKQLEEYDKKLKIAEVKEDIKIILEEIGKTKVKSEAIDKIAEKYR